MNVFQLASYLGMPFTTGSLNKGNGNHAKSEIMIWNGVGWK